jgi:hypothetical protein
MEQSLPSVGIATLQAQIREYVALLGLIKKRREDLKTMTTTLKSLSDDILDTMQEQNIPSCVSQGYTFTVKDKAKMKSATAKSFLVQVKEHFRISDDAMAEFVEKSDRKRKQEAEHISILECKAAKKEKPNETNIPQNASSDHALENLDMAPTLSGTIDDMYS